MLIPTLLTVYAYTKTFPNTKFISPTYIHRYQDCTSQGIVASLFSISQDVYVELIDVPYTMHNERKLITQVFYSKCFFSRKVWCDQGLAHAVPPTNTNFKPLLLPTQAGIPYTNTHKHRTSYFKSTLTFMAQAKRWKCLSAARQKPEILAVAAGHGDNPITFKLAINNHPPIFTVI